MNIKNHIEAIMEALDRADSTTHTLFDASKSLGALIVASSHLVEIVKEQQAAIERLQDLLPSTVDGAETLMSSPGVSNDSESFDIR